MPDTSTHDTHGFVADEPEHCHDCYRLVRPVDTYYLTIDNAVLCTECIRAADAIRLSGGLTVEIGEDRLLVRRGDVVEVMLGEVRHLADAPMEGVARLVEAKPGAESQGTSSHWDVPCLPSLQGV